MIPPPGMDHFVVTQPASSVRPWRAERRLRDVLPALAETAPGADAVRLIDVLWLERSAGNSPVVISRKTSPASPSHRAIRAERRRKLFVTTLTELNAIAALARMGLRRTPKAG